MRAIMCLTLIWRGCQFQRSTSVRPLIVIYQGKDQFRGRPGADDEYVDQAAIFAHSDKGFTINKLATQWLEGYLDARRVASVLGHGVLQMASSLDRHQTDSSIDFVRYAERDHLLVISRTFWIQIWILPSQYRLKVILELRVTKNKVYNN